MRNARDEKLMGTLREKGKIPHSEWPNIVARYGKGETIAQIGRDYGCTAPAIRYIVKRSGELKGGGSAREQLATVRAHEPSVRADLPAVVVVPQRRAGEHVLRPELRQRVSGDVASFLVALDQAVLEGSRASVANLQEATDRLMRSAARTRLELERLLAPEEVARPREHSRKRAGSAPSGT
jgi:hypothetical protein